MEERLPRSPDPGAFAQTLGGIDPSIFKRGSQDRAPRSADDLHICPSCSSELVLPTEWSPAPGRRWLVELRCPDCEWTGNGVFSQAVVDRFDEVLDLGTEALLADLNLLARANMEEEVERFVAALQVGHVLPEDF